MKTEGKNLQGQGQLRGGQGQLAYFVSVVNDWFDMMDSRTRVRVEAPREDDQVVMEEVDLDPYEETKHAISEGTKAVTKYISSK